MPQINHDPLPEIKDDFEFTATFEVVPDVKDIDFKKSRFHNLTLN
jgi:trigger factor